MTYALTQLALLGCAVLTLDVAVLTQGMVTYTFNNMFVADLMGDVLKLGAYIAVFTTLVYSRAYLADRGMCSGEFFALVLFALLGIMVMISANHFLTLYLGLELLSLSLYALVALRPRLGPRHRGGDEILRAGRAGFRSPALRHVDALRRDRHARHLARWRGRSARPIRTRSC